MSSRNQRNDDTTDFDDGELRRSRHETTERTCRQSEDTVPRFVDFPSSENCDISLDRFLQQISLPAKHLDVLRDTRKLHPRRRTLLVLHRTREELSRNHPRFDEGSCSGRGVEPWDAFPSTSESFGEGPLRREFERDATVEITALEFFVRADEGQNHR